MRSSEEMAMVLFRAWFRQVGTVDVELDEVTWDQLPEWMQQAYLAQVNALLEYLFEHGRISSYLNAKQLEAFKEEYRAYLAEKERIHHDHNTTTQ